MEAKLDLNPDEMSPETLTIMKTMALVISDLEKMKKERKERQKEIEINVIEVDEEELKLSIENSDAETTPSVEQDNPMTRAPTSESTKEKPENAHQQPQKAETNNARHTLNYICFCLVFIVVGFSIYGFVIFAVTSSSKYLQKTHNTHEQPNCHICFRKIISNNNCKL